MHTATPPTPAGPPSPEFLGSIPRDFARRHLLISEGEAGGVERLAVSPQSDPAAIFNTSVRLRRPFAAALADPELIARRIDQSYAELAAGRAADPARSAPPPPDRTADELDRLIAQGERDLLSTEGKAPAVRLVDLLLFEALGRNASDIHIQPLPDRALVRYRVDGVLHTARVLPQAMAPAVSSRIKVMGRMDIAERRLAQDGRATVTIGAGPGARVIDLRLSTFPTSHGERVVIRLLESGAARIDGLDALGMPADIRAAYQDRASRASGIVLVTGPTGSGKTTTLYATLRWLTRHRSGELNILTIEDPIEYELSSGPADEDSPSAPRTAISQSQVNTRKGVTFASGLRNILRQDPDVIMVGEIRDAETARIAIQASLTGHLVFSTLHTGDAPAAATRLMDLGVEPYLVGASLSAVLAQRLVRRVHAPCAGRGCAGCFNSGLLGRTGIFELLAVDDAIRECITRAAPAAEIRRTARAAGTRTLEEDGRRLVAAGLTTDFEVARAVGGAL